MIKPLFALAAVLLAACTPAGKNDSAEAVNAAVADNADVIANDAAPQNVLAAVLAMPERQRNVVFVRAILDAGLKCEGVTASERLPDMDGKPLWRADCKGGNNSHMITITPDGTANIVSRTDR